MVFDKIQINDNVYEAEGQLTMDESLIKIMTTDGEVGLFFNQIDSNHLPVDELVIYKGETDRFHQTKLKLTHFTVVGGNYRMELQK